jgi:hypothetical protein
MYIYVVLTVYKEPFSATYTTTYTVHIIVDNIGCKLPIFCSPGVNVAKTPQGIMFLLPEASN